MSWVQPRILTPPQVAQMKDWIGSWIQKVSTASTNLEDQAVGM